MTTKRFMRTWGMVLGPSLALAVLCGLAYWTWCWGYWGRGNPLMQYWFQCKCQAASEAARFRPFTILASACLYPSLHDISPSGRFMLFSERLPQSRLLHYDFETGQMREINMLGGINLFVNDSLLLTRSRDEAFLLDLNNDTKIALTIFESNSYQTPQAEIEEVLRGADQVIAIGDDTSAPLILALAHDYRDPGARNEIIDPGGRNGYQKLIKILIDEGIAYYQVPPPYGAGGVHDVHYSLGGRFWADGNGIYLADTGQRIIEAWQPGFPRYGYSPQGWVNNDRAVVYGQGGYGYLLVTDIFGNYFPVPQPILLLEVPQQYWVTSTPEP